MKSALLTLLRLYQRLISPLLLPACRYVPTCSQYAAEAVEFHGVGKGALLAAWRLLRCHPLARGGFDPVPPCTHAHVAHAYVAHAPSCVHPNANACHPERGRAAFARPSRRTPALLGSNLPLTRFFGARWRARS